MMMIMMSKKCVSEADLQIAINFHNCNCNFCLTWNKFSPFSEGNVCTNGWMEQLEKGDTCWQ